MLLKDEDMIEYKVKVFPDRKEWRLAGRLHRENGPAVEYANGSKYWYVEGKPYTEEEYNKMMNRKIILDEEEFDVDLRTYNKIKKMLGVEK